MNNLVFYSNRGESGADQGSLVKISGAESFINESSLQGEAQLSSSSTDSTTRLPGNNTETGYVASFSNIVPGVDQEVKLVISSDNGNNLGRYASAVMLQELSANLADTIFTAYNDFAWNDLTTSHIYRTSDDWITNTARGGQASN